MSLHLMPAWRIGTYGCAVSSWGSWASGPTSAVLRWRWRRRMKRSDVWYWCPVTCTCTRTCTCTCACTCIVTCGMYRSLNICRADRYSQTFIYKLISKQPHFQLGDISFLQFIFTNPSRIQFIPPHKHTESNSKNPAVTTSCGKAKSELHFKETKFIAR